MDFLGAWLIADIAVLGLYALFSLHKVFYTLVSLFCKVKFPVAKKTHKFCVIIPARNEEKVIGNLLDSLEKQDYPREMFDVFVVADNCTDGTAAAASARLPSATVLERFDLDLKGKSHALDYALKIVMSEYDGNGYEAVLFFDADNVLARDFLSEMNKAYDAGAKVCTCYRNSKNWGESWISSGYAISFMSECRFMHNSRAAVRSGTFVSGTGFFVDYGILKSDGGWRYGLLTEDIEFSLVMALRNRRVEYNRDAVLYDEQPADFKTSWRQRLRWAKGFYQCLFKYSARLLRGMFRKGGFACYDMFTVLLPHIFLSAWVIVSFSVRAVYGGVTYDGGVSFFENPLFYAAVLPLAVMASFYLAVTYLYAAAVLIAERKRIGASFWQKARAFFTYPLYMLSYIPIGAAALFTRVSWQPIEHRRTLRIEDLETEAR